MEWAPFLLAMVVVAVLQIAVWRRIQRGDIGVTEVAPQPPDRDANQRADDDPTPTAATCPACGTENDSRYDFCRRCVRSLQP
ncbi:MULTISPECIES: zinc ribbon domain-containing protein [Halobacterium]|uniref:DUF7577 domain-containing protein n=1 Tax=Halobacterium TaxID=2239 RepID=UPI001965FBD6|nr:MULTISPECIES: zinc ribbon domain-containing protein [Halobacterium]MDL0134944.1 zinc ribbon domain-containing protein [Halobacterium salinarum]QRY24329.1 zinc ribbon domain-containing protein [Halobacterium sp. BOL4-2]